MEDAVTKSEVKVQENIGQCKEKDGRNADSNEKENSDTLDLLNVKHLDENDQNETTHDSCTTSNLHDSKHSDDIEQTFLGKQVDDVSDSDYFKCVNEEVQKITEELLTCQKKLAKRERQLEKANDYNDELRKELDKLSKEVHHYRSLGRRRVDVGTQVENNLLQVETEAEHGQGLKQSVSEESIHVEPETGSQTSIADELKSAADEAMQQTGFVYDEQSGLYYDYNTGYYYDSDKALYYDPRSGTYFYFNADTQQYEFHSQVDLSQYTIPYQQSPEPRSQQMAWSLYNQDRDDTPQGSYTCTDKQSTDRKEVHKKKSDRDKKYKSHTKSQQKDVKRLGKQNKDMEEIERVTSALGELRFTSSKDCALETASYSWPPCIRVIVTDSDCLDCGSLFIVTCSGATIGREKDMGHTIIIPDLNVSKLHAEITFDENQRKYTIKDVGSQNGTYLNERRISEVKTSSSLEVLSHADVLQFGCTRLLLHIHPGTETCDGCEPGQVQAALMSSQQKNEIQVLSKDEKIKLQRQQLNQIKKRYGLKNTAYVDNPAALKNSAYTDKAEIRRKTKGSDNPYQPDEAPASVARPIAENNVGHKLLKKMGWSEGESLGKDNEGIQTPIGVTIRANQKAGLGSEVACHQSLDNAHDLKKTQRWIKNQKRFQESSSVNVETPQKTWVKGPTQTN